MLDVNLLKEGSKATGGRSAVVFNALFHDAGNMPEHLTEDTLFDLG